MTDDGGGGSGTDAMEETFARLAGVDDGGQDTGAGVGLYSTLAPLYHAMYAARGRIEGQLATATAYAPPDTATVLELGCGTGALLTELGETYDRAVGADRSREMCRLAARRGAVVRGDTSGFASGRLDLVVGGRMCPSTAPTTPLGRRWWTYARRSAPAGVSSVRSTTVAGSTGHADGR